MQTQAQPHGLLASLRQILSHGAITLLAVVIAFALPSAARYILYDWWPMMEQDPNLLLASEVALASVLVLLFNLAKIAWDGRHKVAMAGLASLVHARHGRRGWIARWRERALVRRLPAARDAYILTATGYDTLVEPGSAVRGMLEKAYDIRVMMVNPIGSGMRRRVDSLSEDVTLLSFHSEIEASIAFLSALRKVGKKVALKFYDEEPFWKLVVLGDHVWVQHCHSGVEVRQQPEYVFALNHQNPRLGFFVPFYMHFLNLWNDARHPEYDFDSNELIHRDSTGNEQSRMPLGVPINGACAVRAPT
ncbi:MAG: hypothetical protein JSS40_10750 [Proteobacteria bacterium]|nr:hypothetical protein [Pseudomonadota bacterium]